MIEELRKAIREFKAQNGATEIEILCGNGFYWKLMNEAQKNSDFLFGSITHFNGNKVVNSLYVPSQAAFLMDVRWYLKAFSTYNAKTVGDYIQEYPLIKLVEESAHWKFLVHND